MLAPPRREKPVVLSASSLAAFAQCPTKFRLQYQHYIRPAEDGDALRKGSHVHDLFDRCLLLPDDEVIAYLSEKYKEIPPSKDPLDWETERNTLLALFLQYRHYWANDPVEIETAEHPFKIELEPGLIIQGKIDGLGTWNNQPVIVERKTTSTSLDDEDYWHRLRMDMQISIYTLYLAEQGRRLSTLYDVIRRPTIRLKKTEKPEEFYSRLCEDITERPTHYYARREIPRLDSDLDTFRAKLRKMARAIRAYMQDDCWWENMSACRNPYPCPYIRVCYGAGADAAIENIPNGFVRLTRDGKGV